MIASEITDNRAVRLELPLDLHRELRIAAAKQDTSMAALTRAVVEAYLADRRDGGKS